MCDNKASLILLMSVLSSTKSFNSSSMSVLAACSLSCSLGGTSLAVN